MDGNNNLKDLIKKYRKAEEILINKDSTNIDEKYGAWRQQANIIEELFKSNERLKYDLLERHCSEQQLLHLSLNSSEFVKKRLKNIENIQNIENLNPIFPSNENDKVFLELTELTARQDNAFEQITLKLSARPSTSFVPLKEQESHQPLLAKSNEMGNFKTAAQILMESKPSSSVKTSVENQQKQSNKTSVQPFFNYGLCKKSLGARIMGNVNTIKEKPPKSEEIEQMNSLMTNPSLKCFDTKIIELITSEIIQKFKPVKWDEIAGLDYAKSVIKEAVVYPLLRPDIFTGLRRPPRGILLFGPPGTGKTLIGKCIASQSKSTFFNISASSLTSKWVGESEKLVRALFAVAVACQPSIIFIDEVDSLLAQRSDNENECTRRLKTEFLVRLDGAATLDSERILIVGATNRPQELDEAVRRRFIKRLYVALPEYEARLIILKNSLQMVSHNISSLEFEEIAKFTEGYSGADMDSLCREASMEPLRSISIEDIETFDKDNLRPVNFADVKAAIIKVRPSVSQQDLKQYVDWNKTYGSYM